MGEMDEWADEDHVAHYRARAAEPLAGVAPDAALLEALPDGPLRVLDLGTGDGRLLELVLAARPGSSGVGLDRSPLMLGAARDRLRDIAEAEVLEHDLVDPLPDLGPFDAVVSSLAIHHLEHDRKASLYAETYAALKRGGTLVNFDHVASASERLHRAFFAAIDEPLTWEDPSDRLLDVESQLQMLRAAGFDEVDCHWKWRELALIAGVREGEGDGSYA